MTETAGMIEPLTEWPQPPRRSMRSTIAAVEGLATRSAPVNAPTSLDGDGFTIGFATGYTAGILTAAAIAATGWLMVYLTMHEVSPWGAAMVVLALVYVALLLVDRMFPPGRVHRRAVRPIVRTPTEGTKGD